MSGRVIKFRAWDVIEKKYMIPDQGTRDYPSLIAIGLHGLPISISPDSFKPGEIVGWNRDHNIIIEQFTGFLDVKGVEIYEGDLIKVSDDYENYGQNAGEVYEVYFNAGGFRCKPHNPDYRGFWIEDGNDFTVIGNIHDTHTTEAGR